MHTRFFYPFIGCCLILSIGLILQTPASSDKNAVTYQVYRYSKPVDALSIGVPESVAMRQTDTSHRIDLFVQGFTGTKWTEWEQLELEKEFDPLLSESNLIIFPKPVTSVRVAGGITGYDIHPITVSNDPIRLEVASTVGVSRPKILTRRQWQADPEFLYSTDPTTRSDTNTEDESDTSTNASVPERVQKCNEAVANFPQEFKASKTVTHDRNGRKYRWAQQYSSDVKMLVVHHTALLVSGDERTPVERMRALYTYHANNRGWGDIGYHYVIDETGQIYEGKAGGDYVVGGHIYCGNIGTVGVALMGNFEQEKPTQDQMNSLQWILGYLGQKYQIDVQSNVQFHGKTYNPIIGHGDYVDTACPGFYIRETLASQVLPNVQKGITDGTIRFPEKASVRAVQNTTTVAEYTDGLEAIGSNVLKGRPGQEIALQVHYMAQTRDRKRRNRIGNVVRSDSRIGLTQEFDGKDIPVRSELLLPRDTKIGQSTRVRLTLTLPLLEGEYTLHIGPLQYQLIAEGRPLSRAVRTSQPLLSFPSVSTQRVPSSTTSQAAPTSVDLTTSQPIRIRLESNNDTLRIQGSGRAEVQGRVYRVSSVQLSKRGDACLAGVRNRTIRSESISISFDDDLFNVVPAEGDVRRYRGTVECRVIDNELVLINELPIEHYLLGLAEEPDNQHFEKQKAFAIAARSYAAHYMQDAYSKFPGKPYDGDDSAARFQKYKGLAFEQYNPKWVKAVHDTAGLVLTKNSEIVRAAYFSASDGRTRSPEELGWNSFPHIDVFVSKADPWCAGLERRGHGVGMSGCGATGQAEEGKKAEEILQYYYTGVRIESL